MTAINLIVWKTLEIILADGRTIQLKADDTIYMGQIQKSTKLDLTDHKGSFTYEAVPEDTVIVLRPKGSQGREVILPLKAGDQS